MIVIAGLVASLCASTVPSLLDWKGEGTLVADAVIGKALGQSQSALVRLVEMEPRSGRGAVVIIYRDGGRFKRAAIQFKQLIKLKGFRVHRRSFKVIEVRYSPVSNAGLASIRAIAGDITENTQLTGLMAYRGCIDGKASSVTVGEEGGEQIYVAQPCGIESRYTGLRSAVITF